MKYHRKRVCLYGVAIVLFFMTMLTIIVTAGFVESEQQELYAFSYDETYIDTQEPTPEIVNEVVEEVVKPSAEESAEEIIEEAVYTEPAEELIFKPYDIPLSVDLQRYTYNLCIERGLDFEMVLALMDAESSYKSDLISQTNDYGLMQVNEVHHSWLTTELGITDFLDAKQNIKAGTFLLANITKKYSDPHQILMVYNFGEAGAKNCWNKGIYSSKYSRKITAKADVLRNQ